MALSTDTGLDRVISAFEDGWAFAATCKTDEAPSYVEPTLLKFWQDGYDAGVADKCNVQHSYITIH